MGYSQTFNKDIASHFKQSTLNRLILRELFQMANGEAALSTSCTDADSLSPVLAHDIDADILKVLCWFFQFQTSRSRTSSCGGRTPGLALGSSEAMSQESRWVAPTPLFFFFYVFAFQFPQFTLYICAKCINSSWQDSVTWIINWTFWLCRAERHAQGLF